MNQDNILLSTAYLPPIDYFTLISLSENFLIEKWENYIKQSYRNRCYILSAHGPQLLTVPVLEGSRHKVPITGVTIDYSKRWQQVHLGAIRSSYRMAPYYQFFSGEIEDIISRGHKYLWDLNNDLLTVILRILKCERKVQYTNYYEHPENKPFDFRYRLDPGKEKIFTFKKYFQVFNTVEGFAPGLSILDLIFNQGPEACTFLVDSPLNPFSTS